MGERIKSLLIYAAKCVTGTIIVFIFSSLLNYKDLGWCLISVILVLSPDGTDAVTLAFTRIKANTIGAGVGLLCLLISPMNMWVLSLALIVTLIFCYLFKLDAGARSALAATIIIMLHEEGKHVWDTALERVIAVLGGCILGLLITFAFHFNLKKEKTKDNNQSEA
jgi:uncharacterized membrane protein YgaE (UPF0421/DUF939 family)